MTDDTRRGYLQTAASLGFTGTITRITGASSTSDHGPYITASDLVLSNSAVQKRFRECTETESGRFLEYLYAQAPSLSTADTATTCYWDGGTQDDPHWVLSSFALVAEDTLPRGTIEDATRASTDAYVTEYDAETNSFVEFETSHAQDATTSDRRVEIIDTSGLHGLTDGDSPLFADLMRHQFFENVLLSTVVFGPRDDPPALEAMLDEYASHQRIQYRTHGGME